MPNVGRPPGGPTPTEATFVAAGAEIAPVSVQPIDPSAFGRYRKSAVAAAGVILVALGLYADGAWSFDDTRTLVETVLVALGIYEVPNDPKLRD